MAILNRRTQTIRLQVVYCGAARAGKTTNLVRVHQRYPPASRSPLGTLQVAGRDLPNHFSARLAAVRDYQVVADFVSAPPMLTADDHELVEHADGIVFVAHSGVDMQGENLRALVIMRELIGATDDAGHLPIVFQWNGRDVDNAVKLKTLEQRLNPSKAPSVEAVAKDDIGVWETQRTLVGALIQRLTALLDEPGSVIGASAGDGRVFFPLRGVSFEAWSKRGRRKRRPITSLDLTEELKPRRVRVATSTTERVAPTPPPKQPSGDPVLEPLERIMARADVDAAAWVARDGRIIQSVDTGERLSLASRPLSAVSEHLKRAALTAGLEAPTSWCCTTRSGGWFVGEGEEGFHIAKGPGTGNVISTLRRIYGRPNPARGE